MNFASDMSIGLLTLFTVLDLLKGTEFTSVQRPLGIVR